MMPWNTQEISSLIGCWPTASAPQISRLLNRSRASICGKAMRLRRGKLLPADVQKNFEVKPRQTRLWHATTSVPSITPEKPTPAVDASVPPSAKRRCSLLELNTGQCRWPLGDVHQVLAQFCGEAVLPGSPYCGHHLGMRRNDRGLPHSEEKNLPCLCSRSSKANTSKKSLLCREHHIAGCVGLDQRADINGLPLNPNVIVRQPELISSSQSKVSRRLSWMALETNAHARVRDTFWLKSHLYPMMLKSNACVDCPWITFAKPKDLNENGSPRGNLAKKSPQP
jgi:GcrA cell cycle regulator